MFVSLLPSSTVPLLIINTATNMSGSVNMKEALHEAQSWALRMLSRKSNSNTPIPSTGQQRDALPLICVPCTDGEREEGS